MYNILNVVQWKGEHKRAHTMPSKPSHYFFVARCTTFKQGSPHDLTTKRYYVKHIPILSHCNLKVNYFCLM